LGKIFEKLGKIFEIDHENPLHRKNSCCENPGKQLTPFQNPSNTHENYCVKTSIPELRTTSETFPTPGPLRIS
jgi:hypothetical protein